MKLLKDFCKHLVPDQRRLGWRYNRRARIALGGPRYGYCEVESGASRIRLPRWERPMRRVRRAAPSCRSARAARVGISDQTSRSDVASGVVNHYTANENQCDTGHAQRRYRLGNKQHPKHKPKEKEPTTPNKSLPRCNAPPRGAMSYPPALNPR